MRRAFLMDCKHSDREFICRRTMQIRQKYHFSMPHRADAIFCQFF